MLVFSLCGHIPSATLTGPGHFTVLTGSSLHGLNHQHRMYRNLCCTGHADYVPARHLRIVTWRC